MKNLFVKLTGQHMVLVTVLRETGHRKLFESNMTSKVDRQ